ncbi:carboxypeptidase regulatory-like domain-containing protein [Oryzomonas japonica]|uniref:Carboxypeptidase regulatory-like domain-containing protein n=1 Tax=Oryzomonas japonica TaxID=2603858 RepID=A0A7J4ZN95_9BACT|nr:carboxypeptidase-like regulatory domain-containing protein [Oryzomonas japonica]KAB0664179.1 carboxypeptidase regulatory-like domain-containing protein [Oryzomonas japonica]
MTKVIFVVLTTIMLFVSGCSGPLTGIVIDDESKTPIEGAIVHAEWFVTVGIGLSHTETYAIQEAVTDKEGKFKIPGVSLLRPSITPPEVIVYKKGYVAWNSKAIYRFPEYDDEMRTDFKWGKDIIFKMERFKKTYAHNGHIQFIESYLDLSKEFVDAISWEFPLASNEGELYRARSVYDTKTSKQEIFREIIKELHQQEEDHIK